MNLLKGEYEYRMARRDNKFSVINVPLAWLYAKSNQYSIEYKNYFNNIEKILFFIGHGRSGHSIIGSLLDTHPEMVIGHEVDALYLHHMRFSWNQIFSIIINNSKQFAEKGRGWTGYSYKVPNQWQGKFRKLKGIGDKRGAGTTLVIDKKPKIIDSLPKEILEKIRLIYHIRNPFDSISTLCLRNNLTSVSNEEIDCYFEQCRVVDSFRKKHSRIVFVGYHEKFIAKPKYHMRSICNFLEVSAPKRYLDGCASIVYKTPSISRNKIAWKQNQINTTQKQIDKFDHLKHYSYHN